RSTGLKWVRLMENKGSSIFPVQGSRLLALRASLAIGHPYLVVRRSTFNLSSLLKACSAPFSA
ncbi:MAG TPA: hypothetical protein VK785_06420, partial [Opitutaceae bacterium]|nr:hypothetical protein [Opitutaceae bacterium]